MTDDRLKAAPLAYQNEPFLNSPDGRILRILSEYAEPLSRFRREQIQDTVVFFGSARFQSREVAQKAVKQAQAHGENHPKTALAAVEMAHYYEDARKLASMLTEWSITIPARRRRFVVTTGGGPGIMEAANPAFRVPLLLHAEVLVRLPGQSAGNFPRRFRDLRRTLRNPHPGPD